ncbi:MAG: serpin family protein [Chloroflexi bacterium]|nr:serpin family protein [Chloroflexota bacterium]
MRPTLSIIAIVASLIVVACAQTGTPTPTSGVIKSDKARITGMAAPASDLSTLARDNAAFATNLYAQLRAKPGGNLLFSPHSVSSALAMTYAGALGNTSAEMAAALRYGLPADRLHAAFNSLDLELAARGQGAQGKDGKGFRLKTVNALWGQSGYKFLPGFLDVLAQNYGAGLRVLDFQKAPEPSRQTINQWVSEQTEKRIPELIGQGVIDPSTVLVLTNAIYFNAAWADQFDAKSTRLDQFTLLDGKTADAQFMRRTGNYRYASSDAWQAVELPYDGRELAMLVLLPAPGKFDDVESALPAALDGALNGMKPASVFVSLPRWKFETSYGLSVPLQALGMKDAFSAGKADFSGMDGTRSLFIGAVIHKAFIAVDEAGTEAAAATAVVMPAAGAAGPQPVEFRANRPFVFAIRDLKTGAVLFIGRVLNPAA